MAAPSAAATGGELVLVVGREQVMPGPGWHGVLVVDPAPYLALVEQHGRFLPRSEAEDDPSWKQVIPYLVLRDRGRLFLMQRTRAGGDARLHERWTIGVGGHVGPADGGVLGGLRREWTEELAADWLPQPRLLGLLNDDSTPVGRVHLGFVYEAEAGGREVAIRETEKLRGSFVAPDEVRPVYEQLETWSQLVFDFLERGEGMG